MRILLNPQLRLILEGLPGVPVELNVRGKHGKVYGMWLPPDNTRVTRAIPSLFATPQGFTRSISGKNSDTRQIRIG